MDAKTQRNRLMIDKLYDQLQCGCLPDGFVTDFVLSVRDRLKMGIELSQKQQATLENLFEQY